MHVVMHYLLHHSESHINSNYTQMHVLLQKQFLHILYQEKGMQVKVCHPQKSGKPEKRDAKRDFASKG